MEQTKEFVLSQLALPEDAAAATELPEPVVAELGAAGLSVGVILTLLPQILSFIRLVTSDGATVAQIVAAVLELLRSFKANG